MSCIDLNLNDEIDIKTLVGYLEPYLFVTKYLLLRYDVGNK
jgi:hypothetical protein